MPRLLALSLVAALAPSTGCAGSGGAPPDAAIDTGHARDASRDTPPACPLENPSPGAACSLPASFDCSFGDPCSFTRWACRNAKWDEVIEDGAVPETCPDAAPSTGSTCASCGKSYRCVYEASCATTTSICSGGHWLTGASDCDGGADATGGPG